MPGIVRGVREKIIAARALDNPYWTAAQASGVRTHRGWWEFEPVDMTLRDARRSLVAQYAWAISDPHALAFFFRPPPPPLSLRFCQRYICDPCERETGEEVEAHDHCAGCGEDLCIVHCVYWRGPLAPLFAADLPATRATLVKKHRHAQRCFGGRLTLCEMCNKKVRQARCAH